MSPSLDTFTAGTATPVDVAQIERQLRQLWREGEEGEHVFRACLFNLLVWCESDADHDRATALIHELTNRHPCRAIVLQADPQGEEALLEASISAHCHLAGGGRGQVCSEQISIHASGEAVAQLAPTVFSLLESDLPAVLWWRGNFLEKPEQFRRLLPVVDRVIFDTAAWKDSDCWLPVLAAEMRGESAHIFADLNWSRLTLWRKLTADCFDEAQYREVLPQVRRVTVRHGTSPGARLRALLYAGWLAAQLGWSVAEAKERVLVRECSGEDVAEVGIESVDLSAAEASLQLRKDFTHHTAAAVVTLPELCSLPRKQAFAPLTEAGLMSQELDHVAPHAAYERAVAVAGVLALGGMLEKPTA